MRKFTMTVEVEAEDVSAGEVRDYVSAALRGWGGQFDPADPFFGDNKTTLVKSVRIVKKASTKRYERVRR